MSTCVSSDVTSRAKRYLPSYLVVAAETFHVLFAADVVDDNVRVVTAYRPDPEEWEPNLRRRKVS
jgi:hypothetical protein